MRHRYGGVLMITAATPAPCRRCTECVGEEHHWLTAIPELPEDGAPYIPCKHCDARVWPIVSDQPICAECRMGAES